VFKIKSTVNTLFFTNERIQKKLIFSHSMIQTVRVYLWIEYTIKHFIRVRKTRRNFLKRKAEACTYIWKDNNGM